MKRCERCGADHSLWGLRCAACGGAAQPGRSQEQEPPGAAGLLVDPRFWRASRPRSAPRAARGVEHYLVPAFGEWLKLETGRKLIVGRGERCDVRLHSPSVSRRHAELAVTGAPPNAFLKDLSATNVTRVNGVPLTAARALADGDVVRFGEVTAIYRRLDPSRATALAREAKPPSEALDSTIPLGDAGQRALQGLSGDAALVPMTDLFGRLTILRATGRFVVEVDGVVGHAVFGSGTIQEAKFAGFEMAEAIQALSKLTRGLFRFEPT